MENKDLTAGKREAIFILRNKNKTYAEIAKLLKISRISVYYTLKIFGPTSFSSHKNQSDRRRKTTKNDDRIVDHKQAKSSSNCIRHHFGDEPEPADIRLLYPKIPNLDLSEDFFPLPNCRMLMIFAYCKRLRLF
jgi:hypothetical protein